MRARRHRPRGEVWPLPPGRGARGAHAALPLRLFRHEIADVAQVVEPRHRSRHTGGVGANTSRRFGATTSWRFRPKDAAVCVAPTTHAPCENWPVDSASSPVSDCIRIERGVQGVRKSPAINHCCARRGDHGPPRRGWPALHGRGNDAPPSWCRQVLCNNFARVAMSGRFSRVSRLQLGRCGATLQ